MSDLQLRIQSAAPGTTIEVPTGRYRGHLKIDRPVNLKSQGLVVFDGEGLGTVVTLTGDDVHFDGFAIVGSGESHTDSDAAIEVTGQRPVLENLKITNCFFGLKVKGVSGGRFQNNRIESYSQHSTADRGDAFFVWNSHDNLFLFNEIHHTRDFSLNNSVRNLIRGNTITDSRTGIYMVFAKGTVLQQNHLLRNSTGMAGIYSPEIRIENNLIAHSLDGNGSCISTKDSMGSSLVGNRLVHCSVGYLSDAPSGDNLIGVDRNLFAHNYVGVRVYGQKGSHRFSENVFRENLVTLILPLDGPAEMIQWRRNYWDEYRGFGKEPHQDIVYSDRIWMETPMAQFFRDTPFFEMIDFLERLAPFSSPNIQAIDFEPQTIRSSVYLIHQDFSMDFCNGILESCI